MIAWFVALAAEPSDQTLVYYNARLALREERAQEAVKLWLLRNTIADRTGRVSPYDADFGSVTWAALGDLGVCPDGHPDDDEGAGLWPIAMHNWLVRTMGRSPKRGLGRPFDAFELDRQARFVSISDVLDADELATVQLHRGGCLRPRLALLSIGEFVTADLANREVSARLLRWFLERSRATLASGRVRGLAAVEARLFDLDLHLTAVAAQEANRRARAQARRGREIGLSPASIAAMEPVWLPPEATRIVRGSVAWPPSEWMTLSPDRRRFVFHHAREQGGDPVALDGIALGVIDALIARGEGADVEAWIALRVGPADAVWGGERGKAILALDREAGFRERAVVALHRGVDHLQRGELPEALRSVAWALELAPESRAADEVEALSRRWLSYVVSRFVITDELLVTLQELVDRRDYGILLEDMMWRAAFHADATSFGRGLERQLGGAALERRLALLWPLARGDVGRFTVGVRDGLRASPGETLRFVDQLVERLELEDADVRAAVAPALTQLVRLLEPLVDQGGGRGRSAEALTARTHAILEGVGGVGEGARERARSLAPDAEVYAGSVRLAPSDPLPWPFQAPEPVAPSVFAPLRLVPVEWRDAEGELVFGWRIEG